MPSRAILIGWEGVDWRTLRPLVDAGRMPHVAALLARGTLSELAGEHPFEPATLWTPILTGKRPAKHGVLDALELAPRQTHLRPVRRPRRHARAAWTILDAHGVRTASVGWPASHPAEPLAHGVAVSDHFFTEQDAPGAVHPPARELLLDELRLEPAEIDPGILAALVPGVTSADFAARDARLAAAAEFVASTAGAHAVATQLLEEDGPDFLAVRYAGLGRIVERLGHERGRPVIDAALGVVDKMVGRQNEQAGPGTAVVLLSACGPVLRAGGPAAAVTTAATAGGGSYEFDLPPRRAAGFVLLSPAPAAAAEAARSRGSGPTLYDITPTLLALFGVPSAADMDGRAYRPALDSAAPAQLVATHEHVGEGRSTGAGAELNERESHDESKDDDDDDARSVAHLVALGYVDSPDEQAARLAERFKRGQRYRRAAALMGAAAYAEAAEELEALLASEPRRGSASPAGTASSSPAPGLTAGSVALRTLLAEAQFRGNRRAECRRTVESLRADGVDTALARVALAALEAAAGRREAALQHLRTAEEKGPIGAEVQELIGQAYFRLRLWDDAARALTAGASADPVAGAGMEVQAAAARLAAGDAEGAEQHARAALALDPQSAAGHHRLGLALLRQARHAEAADALRRALSLGVRAFAAVHRHLATACDALGDTEGAMQHRWAARQREMVQAGPATARPTGRARR
jgi:tetratricopeptide (TPR) repeat protein